jgi:hypothetical protein
MAREDDSDSRPLGATPQRVHFGGHRNTCRCALFSREKVNQKSSLGKYYLPAVLSYSCPCHTPESTGMRCLWIALAGVPAASSCGRIGEVEQNQRAELDQGVSGYVDFYMQP